jgi:hypothetical protein
LAVLFQVCISINHHYDAEAELGKHLPASNTCSILVASLDTGNLLGGCIGLTRRNITACAGFTNFHLDWRGNCQAAKEKASGEQCDLSESHFCRVLYLTAKVPALFGVLI